MDVVRDVLDELVVDRNGHEMGRVDGIVLEQRAGQPPRLGAILIGPAALGYRIHPRLGRVVKAIEERFGVSRGRPVQIPFDKVEIDDRKLKALLTIEETAADVVEQWLRRWVRAVPGSR
jgi:hypothetical protein